MKQLLLLIVFVSFGRYGLAQDSLKKDELYVLYQLIENGDTFLVADLEEVYIFPKKKFKNRFEAWRYRRLIENVKKTYPYAKLAKGIFDKVNTHLSELETERDRKAYIEQVEKELLTQYEDDLKSMTITQGRLLLKLINREIGETSYDLLKEYRGNFSAFFWQALARLFGNNLKSTFDAEGEDKLVNDIIIMIDKGYL